MTRYQNLLEGSNGVAITAANSGVDGDAFGTVATTSPAASVFDTSRAFQGSSSLKVTPSGSTQLTSMYWTVAGSGHVSMRGYFYLTAAPAGGLVPMWLGAAGASSRASIDFRPTGKLRVNMVGGAAYDTSASYPLNDWVRVELEVWKGTTTTNGRIKGAMYLGSSTTPIESWDVTTANTGTDDFVMARYGSYSASTTSTSPIWIDAVAFDDAANGFIGPYAVTLATPVVTLEAKTDASTVGGKGTQIASWPAVPGAVSYEAWLADGTAPAQGDFVRVAQGVTSPYQFTNVGVGTHAYGIKAKGS